MLAMMKILTFNIASASIRNRGVCIAGRRKMHCATRARIADDFDNVLDHRKH
jgi:hypothetical protein